MADYKAIKGESIQTVCSDLSNTILGQVWYNETTRTLNYHAAAAAAWASGGNMNTARQIVAGAGIQTAALVFGGNVPNTALNESYDGSSWTEVGDLNTARRAIGGIGISTAALATCGYAGAITNINESWNGSENC